jgi:hypothetical protein
MADYPISNVPRRIVYTGSAGVGPYAFNFEVLLETDINVYKNDVLLTITTDYTVAISPTLGTGSVTLVSAAAGTDRITIVGARAVERTTDFTTGGDFFANTVNSELDSQTILTQQIAETAERSIKAPVTDPTNINMTLPINTVRAGTTLAFDADGNPIAGPTVGAVGTVSQNIANVNTVATNINSVNTVAGNTTNVNTVAGISGNVTTVAGISGNVTAVANNAANVNTVATNITNVNATGANIANVNAVAGNATNINAVNANKTNIDTVASVSGSVTTVAGISGNVTKVADVDTAVTTVAGISSNVATVAGISGNVTTVAGNTTNINTVAANNTNISTVATNVSNVNVVAGNTANINTVATNNANITTVAGINAAVSTVATNNANVTAVAANATNINTVAANNTNVTTVATNIASVNTNAANITAIQNASSNAVNVSNALSQVNNGKKDIFVDGTNFTSGTTTTLTLTQTPAKSNFVHVFFDTDYQLSDKYTISGNVITFTSAIVATKVEVVYDVATTLIEDALFNLADKRARADFAREKNTPVIPSLLLDFESDKQLDPRVTFARASTARYYDGKTVAKAEENLFVFSEEFDNAAWVKVNVTVTANLDTAPNGQLTADLVSLAAGTSEKTLNRSVSSNGFFSVYLKSNGHNFVQLRNNSSGNAYVNFDISTGAVGVSGVLVTSPSITSVGNGWYRCSGYFTLSGALYYITAVDSASALWGAQSSSTSSYYIWGAQLEQRDVVTAYTPTTTQPITNYIPVLLTAANNEARFDHNPTTSESLGLLIEEQRTNLVVRSEEFDDAAWTKSNSSITANTVVAPDGTLTGAKFVEDTSSGTHLMTQSVSGTTGVIYTFTAYVKAAERSFLRVTLPSQIFGVTTAWAFNLNTGATTPLASTAGTAATSEMVGNGWLRVRVTSVAATATASGNFQLNISETATTNSYTGDGFSGIYIWGAQLEAGAFPTSYIPTEASQVTRSADAASMTGTNFSSWYRADRGTLYTEVLNAPLNNSRVASLNNNTAAERIIIFRGFGSGGNFNLFVTASSVTQVNSLIMQSSLGAGANAKLAAAYAVNDFAGSSNGLATVTQASGILPRNVTQLTIGSGELVTSNLFGGHIRKLAFYPERLSNTQLQALTT